jgi:MoaA/NifB/PqqE/SkfB family radical SAM enzyme
MNTTNLVRRRLYEATNYRLRTFAAGRFAHLCRPAPIAILLTERCNARCIHCDIWKNRGREDNLSAAQWQQVLKELRDWLGPVHVVLTGGEALLKDFTIDLVRYASSIGLFVELLTHGYWTDQEKIENVALARPSRVTLSFDGIGDIHDLVRGRVGFFAKTEQSIRTLQRVREQNNLDLVIRLKTVIMRQNLHAVIDVARFAQRENLDVFYQPIEQNYNTEDDSDWYKHSDNWPTDTRKALDVVKQLIELKSEGLPIANSNEQLAAMLEYFSDPTSKKLGKRSHASHERQLLCSALTMLQLQANGDVTICSAREPVGNVRNESLRRIWEQRPRWWEGDCCLKES